MTEEEKKDKQPEDEGKEEAQQEEKKHDENEKEKEKSPQELADEYLSGWKRARADYDNLKKETEQKSKEWVELGVMRTIEKIIPAYNNFKQAVAHIPQDQKDSPWVTGIMHIKNNMDDVFSELGLEVIPTVGEKFDPNLHEAVSEVEEEGESGEIVREISVGFKRDGKIILPAKVVVRK